MVYFLLSTFYPLRRSRPRMGFSIIETDRLLICPYHLAYAFPKAAEGGKDF